MNAAAIRISATFALIAALLAGTTAPALADPSPPQTLATKAEPLIKPSCRKDFLRTWRHIHHRSVTHASYYYESRRKAMQVYYDGLRWLLADPQAHELIPGHEAMVERDRETYQPLVAQQRDEYLKEVKDFRSNYMKGKCLTKSGRDVFITGMRYLWATYQDIYKAEENLFGMEQAVETAQVDLAGRYLQDADLEYATVEENFQQSIDAYQRFRG